MLVEQRDVRQNVGELSRRLFWDDTLDLALWFQPDGVIDRFQLSYDQNNDPRVLTWSREKGFSHEEIDYGNHDLKFNRAPMLRPAGALNAAKLRTEFLAAAANLPPAIRSLVDERLAEFSRA